MSDMGQLEVLGTIKGASVQAVEAALKVFTPPEGLSAYEIQILRAGDSDLVVIDGKGAPGVNRYGVQVASGTVLEGQKLDDLLSKDATRVDTLQGTSFEAVRAALVPFRRQGLDLSNYAIEVIQEGSTETVLFMDKDQRPGTRGSSLVPGFEVELDPSDRRHVVRSNFVK